MTRRLFLLCLALSLVTMHLVESRAAESKPVRTAAGFVSGVKNADGSVTVFEGVPYAAPPVRQLRWRPPQEVAPWTGTLKADHFSANCMQGPANEFLPWTKEFLYRGSVSEDCLYLNVWSPAAESRAKRPVLVFIHGGGFRAGSGNVEVYDGEQLAKMGVVVVTINYRVGVFGFFAHPELTAESEHHSSGNYGLLDQIAALQWVKKNIRAFGGDPERVTIAGQSAGAFSVQALIASPLAKGLFRAAIAESGISVAGHSARDLSAAEKASVAFAESRKYHSIQELRAVSAEQLLAETSTAPLIIGPVVDGWVLPESALRLSADGKDSDVPVITGWQADDARSLTRPMSSATEFEQHARKLYGKMADEFLRLYPAVDGEQLRRSESESARDREKVAMYLWASGRAKNHNSPVYTYYFDRAIPWPQHPEYGAFHTGEVPYIFKTLKALDRPYEPADFKVSEMMSMYWKNFVETGDPNGKGLAKWTAVDRAQRYTMRLGAHPGTMPIVDDSRLDFWLRYFQSQQSENAPLF